MLFAVLFNDIPGKGEIRALNLKAHLDWLEKNHAVILVGGSLRKELGEVPKGGLWIAEAESRNDLDVLIKTDPFYTAGLRISYEILYWSKANEVRSVTF